MQLKTAFLMVFLMSVWYVGCSLNKDLPTDATNKEYFELTDNPLIQSEIDSTFKNIYKLQENLNLTQNAPTDYLKWTN